MKSKKLTLPLVIVFLFSMLAVGFASAGNWSSPTLSGYWGTLDPELGFNKNNDTQTMGQLKTYWTTSGDPNIIEGVENFSAFWMNVSIVDLGSPTWTLFSGTNIQTINVDLSLMSGGGGLLGPRVRSNFTIESINNFLGYGKWATFGENLGEKYEIKELPVNFQIYYEKTSATNLKLILGYYDKGGQTTLANGTVIEGFYVYQEANVSVEAGFFDEDIFPILSVTHSGSGHFQFFIYGQEYQNGEMPEIVGGLDLDKAGEHLTNPANWGFLGQVYAFFVSAWSFIAGTVTFIIAMVQAFWPIFPALFIMYLLDMFWTSYQKGGFVAIGDTLYKVYDMLISSLDTAINAIQTVGSYLMSGISWILGLFGIVV